MLDWNASRQIRNIYTPIETERAKEYRSVRYYWPFDTSQLLIGLRICRRKVAVCSFLEPVKCYIEKESYISLLANVNHL